MAQDLGWNTYKLGALHLKLSEWSTESENCQRPYPDVKQNIFKVYGEIEREEIVYLLEGLFYGNISEQSIVLSRALRHPEHTKESSKRG